ncbi:glycosyltransferase [Streptomyces sp. NPDC057307]|uniref:glycosyltransferase n=1 Tax=Streptomyces sp. NPDC057307 TaxID=3346096 RepID=UPI003645C749
MSGFGAAPRGVRIVRLANFVTPASGGLRTALQELGAGYLAAGHEPVLIVPGERRSDEHTTQGRVITLPGTVLPGTGGYRVLTDRRRLGALLDTLAPDHLEVSDRTTLRWTGEWARRRRIPSVMVSHETADGVLRTWGVPEAAAGRAADLLNRRSAWAYSRIVCTTEWAEREFVRIGARNVVRAPLGVDLLRCRPDRRREALRARYARGADVLLLLCSRLSVEKRPAVALDALATLRGLGVGAALVIAGDGPLAGVLARRARERRLPVVFLGHVGDRERLADLQAAADICLAPGPAETFGLSALEALACGTPVVASASSALPEILGAAGGTAGDTPRAFADAVRELLARPEAARRAAARARAELFGWDRAVAAFLAAHEAPARTGRDHPLAEAGTGAGAPVAVSSPEPAPRVSSVPSVVSAASATALPTALPMAVGSPAVAAPVASVAVAPVPPPVGGAG